MTLFSRSVLGVDIWNCTTAILAFSTLVGPPLALLGLHLSKTIPSISWVSSIVPPTFFTIFMSFRSTLVALLESIIFRTESTAMGDSSSVLAETTFEEREVATHSIRVSLFAMSTGIDSSFDITPREWSRAFWKPSDMMLGWMPLSRRDSAAFRKAPASTTTEVVPSPASTSWAFDISTSWVGGGVPSLLSGALRPASAGLLLRRL